MTQLIFFVLAMSATDYLISEMSCFESAFFLVGLFNSAITSPSKFGWVLT